MKSEQTKKLCLAGILCAVAVVGSLFSFPVLGSKCAPVQHTVNILCAVVLGPWYGVLVAFCASLIRNLMGLGSLGLGDMARAEKCLDAALAIDPSHQGALLHRQLLK